MQALYDLLPVLAFYAAFKFAGIYVATAVLMAITVLQVVVQWVRTRTVSKVLLMFSVLALVFGGLTLWIHDDRFIVWKPTVVYALFGIAMLASPFVAGKPLIQTLFEKHLTTDARTWSITNTSWALMWFAIAAGNAVFATRFSRDAWVNWHTAITPIVFVFGIAQAFWLSSRSEATEQATAPPEVSEGER
jgi:intracellular septation protein